MLDRLIIQNALFVNSIKNNGCMLANSSELLCYYQPDVNIVYSLETWF